MCITGPSAGETIFLSMPCHRCVPSMYVCNQSVRSFVLFGHNKPNVWLLVGSFWNNKRTINPVLLSTPKIVGISRCASTPRRHTVEVSASQGPQQATPPPYQCPVVGASHRCTCAVGPISRLCIVHWPDFSHPVHPVHPKWSGSYWFGELAVPALSSVRPVDVHVLSVHPVVCAFWP